MADNREIVGWFTKGGKRIPIFKGEDGKKRMATRYESDPKVAKTPVKKDRPYREYAQQVNRLNLMKSRGVTSWKDVPDYLKRSTGGQTPGFIEAQYGTKSEEKKKRPKINKKK